MAQRLSTLGELTDRLRSGTLGENINIDIVNQSYTTTYGVAVRAESVVDRDALQVAGIVRGVNASIVAPDAGSERQLRRSNLTVEVLQQNESQATLRIELRDNETGAPIVLSDPVRRYTNRWKHSKRLHHRRRAACRDQRVRGGDRDDRRSGYLHGSVPSGSWLGHTPRM